MKYSTNYVENCNRLTKRGTETTRPELKIAFFEWIIISLLSIQIFIDFCSTFHELTSSNFVLSLSEHEMSADMSEYFKSYYFDFWKQGFLFNQLSLAFSKYAGNNCKQVIFYSRHPFLYQNFFLLNIFFYLNIRTNRSTP